MNNSYITIIKEKRTALSRKRVPLNQNECTADFRIGVPFEQNLHPDIITVDIQIAPAISELAAGHPINDMFIFTFFISSFVPFEIILI